MFTLRASSRLTRARARATFASASTAVDASAVLEAARARRAELAPIDRDGGKTAVSSARTMEELCAAVREVKALSAHAAVTAVARAASFASEKTSIFDADADDVEAKLVQALLADIDGLSVHVMARLLHSAHQSGFEAPVAELINSATARIEREGDGVSLRALSSVLWGVSNVFKRRRGNDAELRASLTAFAAAASASATRLFTTFRANGSEHAGGEMCATLKHLLEIHKIIYGDAKALPRSAVEAILKAAARNADALTPTQTSYILHDVIEAQAADALTVDIVQSLTNAIVLDDETTTLSALAGLSWSYAKLDALDRELVSIEHVSVVHDAMRKRLLRPISQRDDANKSRDVAITLYAIARLGRTHPGFDDADFHSAAHEKILSELPELSQRALCMIAWSLNRMRPTDSEYSLHAHFMESVSNAIRRSVHAFSPKELAPTMYSLVSLRCTNPKLFVLARDIFINNVDAYAVVPQNMTLMLWSFATCEMDIGKEALQNVMRAFIANASAASAQETRTIIQSFARLHLTFDGHERDLDNIVRVLNAVVDDHLDEYTHAECQVIAWALLSMRLQASEKLLERVGVESVANDVGNIEYVVHKPLEI